MTPERVKTIIDAYGASPQRWPAEERSAALALIGASPSLAEYQRQAEVLDGVLAFAQQPSAATSLVEAVLASAANHEPAVSVPAPGRSSAPRRIRDFVVQLWPGLPVWQPAVGFAASLAIGVWAGAQGLVPLTAENGGQEYVLLESTDDDALSLIYGDSIGFGEWENDG